jgi:F-type H+-transporting ATPase subunit a
MTAGHVVLFALLGLIFYFKTILISPAIVGFSVFIYFLELLVAFIQAYIFTMLTAIFVGLAIGEHGSDAHAEHATH